MMKTNEEPIKPELKTLFMVAVGTAIGLLLGLATTPVHDFDLFWQLQTGKHMWQTQAFLYRDTFTLAADIPRYEHCWLHDLIFFAAYQLGGYGAISILKGVLIAATATVLTVAARARGASWLAISLWMPALTLIPFWAWRERPQLWSYLAFATFLWLILRNGQNPGKGVWWLLPLTLVWANLHAGVIFIYPLLLAWLVGEEVDYRMRRKTLYLPSVRRQKWLLAVLILIATVLTPYGGEVLKTLVISPFLGESSGALTQIANIDWQATSFSSYPLYFYTLGVALVLVILARRHLATTEILLLLGLGVMGLRLERHTPFFFYAAAVVFPLATDSLLQPLIRGWRGWRWVAAHSLFLLFAVVSMAYWTRLPWRESGFFNPGLRAWHFPVAEADFIRTEQLPGNLFNSYAAGGYLAWRLFPDYRVFWDARQDSPELFALGLKVVSAAPEWRQILERFSINTIVTEACSQVDGAQYPLVKALRAAPEWALVYAGETHLVYVRRQVVSPQWLIIRELPGSRIDDTVLSAARWLVQQTPLRPQAFWEAAQVYLVRGDEGQARALLGIYFKVTPLEQQHPAAVATYRKMQGR